MRILFFYKYDKGYNVDFWLHEGFMRAVNTNPNIESFMYGPNIHQERENKCSLKYDSQYSMNELEEIFKPDVIILNTKSRMFDYYSPPSRGNKATGCILPSDFIKSKIPKIILEEDYHYEDNDDWYSEMNISLILQRHKSQSLRQNKVKMIWFPFSVDINSFKNINKERINKICFVGSMTQPYSDRIFACKILSDLNIIDIFGSREKVGNNYTKNLNEYISHLSSASDYDIVAAKNFEITASGSVLFTNQFTGLQDLFPENSYILWDRNNIEQQARKLLNDRDYAKAVAKAGYEHTIKYHNHNIRTEQLIKIIKENL